MNIPVRKNLLVVLSQSNVINTRITRSPVICLSLCQTKDCSSKNDDNNLFNLQSKSKVSTTDKWIVYNYGLSAVQGKYKNYKEVPDYVSNGVIDRAKARFRIRVNIGLILTVLILALTYIRKGKKSKKGLAELGSEKLAAKRRGEKDVLPVFRDA